MGKIVPLKIALRTMACCNCDANEFFLLENGTIQCINCRFRIDSRWAKSTRPLMAEEPESEE